VPGFGANPLEPHSDLVKLLRPEVTLHPRVLAD
jgi:hypothetical protein